MVTVLGFKYNSKCASWAKLQKADDEFMLLDKGVETFPKKQETSEYTEWAYTHFELLIQRQSPDYIVYKLTSSLDKHEQIFHIYYGLGILNLIARKQDIPIEHIAPQSLRPQYFGLNKSDSLDSYISEYFGIQDSPWNKDVREAISVAFRKMLK